MMTPNEVNHISDVSTVYGKSSVLSKEEIEVIVTNSQAIEGYAPASTETKERVQALMEKYSVKVSF